jgi:hypothetical protein
MLAAKPKRTTRAEQAGIDRTIENTPKKAKTAAPGNGAPGPAPHRVARAELVWEGKYDTAGQRIAPLLNYRA